MGRAFLLLIAAGVLVTACERPPAEPSEKPPPAAIQPKPTPWSLMATGAGLALIHAVDGRETLRLYCTTDGQLGAHAPMLSDIGSEERFSLGVGDRIVVLVAASTDGEPGVTASAGLEEEQLAVLSGEAGVMAAYGASTVGPLPAVPEALRTSFVGSCRSILLDRTVRP